MIKTVFSIKSVPSNWIFEYYCKLEEKLHGQDIKIRSLFKPEERTPSMCIYYTGTEYKYKDFSSGRHGAGINLVMDLYNLPYYYAINKILNDYESKKDNQEQRVFKKVNKYKVTSHIKRNWNELDATFWTQFNIGSTLLNKYNIYPLAEYTLSKDIDGEINTIVTRRNYIYGYFNNSGELCKIYQPYQNDFKFTNVLPYIQGSEQLEYSKPLLIICSSMKDVMSLDSLGYDIECVAPNSENTMLPRSMLVAYSLKYKGILTFFDNDKAGHDSMLKYKDMYGLPGIYLKMSKDLSDSIKDHGVIKVKQYLTPLIPKI